ncbi:hypothetical protein GQ54DRAFT_314110 [Martensiomyces pterosporus]|nr:hypothetical protein GQ54DRAFT_314110 [Martensiomyces pterosporus]
MNAFILAIAAVASSAVSAYPIYGYYPESQTSYHNTGAYDNGATSSVTPYGASSNSWDNGFSAQQGSYLTPYGNAGSSSYNQWNNNAWSNTNYGGAYPRFW